MEYSFFGWYSFLYFVVGAISLPPVAPTAEESQLLEYKVNRWKCHPNVTIAVQGKLENGELDAIGYRFSEGYFWRLNKTHFSVCICKVTKCLRKCCPPNQSFHNEDCVDGFNNPIHPTVHDKDLNVLPNYDFSRFVQVYGNSCENVAYSLYPEKRPDDKYYFLEDGTLYVPAESDLGNYETEDFCFEHKLQTLDQEAGSNTLTVFICFPSEPPDPVPEILPTGMIISIPFLLATFIVYSLPELRNLHGKNLMSHVGSLFVAYTVLVVVQIASNDIPFDLCMTFGYLIQYSFLASFFWLNVMCFDIWWAFSGFATFKGEKKSTETKKYLLYSVYAWGVPTVITSATLIMQFAPDIPDHLLKPDIGHHRCFFTDRKVLLAYFYGPTAVILFCDVLLFVFTAVKIITIKKETVAVFKSEDSRRNREDSKQRYMLYLKLFLIMGVNWIMEVISWAVDGPKWVWYFTDVANTLQGLFVFIIFVCTRRVRRLLISRFCPQLQSKDPNTSSTTKMSLSGNSFTGSTTANDTAIPMNSMSSSKKGS